jgi:hypothetical protein
VRLSTGRAVPIGARGAVGASGIVQDGEEGVGPRLSHASIAFRHSGSLVPFSATTPTVAVSPSRHACYSDLSNSRARIRLYLHVAQPEFGHSTLTHPFLLARDRGIAQCLARDIPREAMLDPSFMHGLYGTPSV